MPDSKQPKNLSIEQAGNLLKEKAKTIPEDMKKVAKEAPISTATPGDRGKYLMYGISLMRDIPESLKVKWCAATGHSSAMYSTREVAAILKKLLQLRTCGHSIAQIAQKLGASIPQIEKSEKLAKLGVQFAIEKMQNTGIPIIGGM